MRNDKVKNTYRKTNYEKLNQKFNLLGHSNETVSQNLDVKYHNFI